MAFLKPYYNEAWYREYEAQKFYLLSNPPKDFLTCEQQLNELYMLIPAYSTFKDPDLGFKLDELYSHDLLYQTIKKNMGKPSPQHLKVLSEMRESLLRDKIAKNNMSTASFPVTPNQKETSSIENVSTKKNKVSIDVVDHNTLVTEKKPFWKRLFGK